MSPNLSNNQLIGSVPEQIGDIDSLRYLNLSFNSLSGNIPESIGNLSNLIELKLHNNDITGALPMEVGNLSNLNILNLYNNQLTGGLPSSLGNLLSLEKLYLHQNQITGAIPESIFNLINVKDFYLSNNQLDGSISSNVSELIHLEKLRLQNNQLTGIVPESICDLNLEWSNQYYFHISNNKLCEPYPHCIQQYQGNQDTSLCSQLRLGEVYSATPKINFQIFPNPFNSSIQINTAISDIGNYRITISDVLGNEVLSLARYSNGISSNRFIWDGRDINGAQASTGVYYVTIYINGNRKTEKILFLK